MADLAADPIETAAEVAHAALMEAGRPDLAGIVMWFEDNHGPYAEVNDDILSEQDWTLVDRAESIGRQAVGLPARIRLYAVQPSATCTSPAEAGDEA